MAHHAQVVAAVAAGGIAGIAGTLIFEVHWLRQQLGRKRRTGQEGSDEHRRRIDSAVDEILGQVEQQRRDVDAEDSPAVEVRTRAHLRLVPRPAHGAGHEKRTARSPHARGQ